MDLTSHAAPVTAVSVPTAVLFAIGVLCWRRTSGSRRGRIVRSGPAVLRDPIGRSTRPATFLPGLSGLGLVAAGAYEAIHGHTPWMISVVLGSSGVVVASLGLGARVTALQLDHHGLSVLYQCRSTFTLPWADWLSLEPPRWPLGGWTVMGRVGGRVRRRVLMPSDLLGHEALLDLMTARAGLRFEGRRWIRSGTEQ